MITFRKAEIKDAKNISSLVNSAYRGEYSKKGWTTEADLLDGQRTDPERIEEIIDASEMLLVLENDLHLIGCVNLVREKEELYFGMLTVEPSRQAEGIGKKMLLEIERIAKKEGFKALRITVVNAREELVAYYERFGFKRTGATEPFPTDLRYGIPKTPNLFLEEFKKVLSE